MFFVGGLIRLLEDVIFFKFCFCLCEIREAFVYLNDLNPLNL